MVKGKILSFDLEKKTMVISFDEELSVIPLNKEIEIKFEE